ncbi:hypothetical protein N7922_24720 (plasmid) [Kosakonia sp. ML.JS2a]|uniref:hypothetical protein n=1 Tax=Kosakonia sp. ML.JS2a TaxID=2980557 RepID=UPI0021D954BA|nr:hypothetical protein [Kosakonia sp. ML.JS2a]UXY13558.1 hypothetical protein N7922_24720 [Kosakonia sp. ML.JS2a]
MKKRILNGFKKGFTGIDTGWLSVREYIKKWCIASFLVLVTLLVTDHEYVNSACQLMQANITGDPSLTSSERFALGALLHYPSFIFRAFECGAYIVFSLTLVSIFIFDNLSHRVMKAKQKAPESGTASTPEVPDV